MHNGVPHLHAQIVGHVPGSVTHVFTVQVPPGGQTDLQPMLDKAGEELGLYSSQNASYTALEGKTVVSCHREVTIIDSKIRIHGFEGYDIFLSAHGSWEGTNHRYERVWAGNSIRELPSPEAVLEHVKFDIANGCEQTHGFAKLLDHVRSIQ